VNRHDLEFRDVDGANWSDLVDLFEAPGGPKHCWCMVWRPKPRGASRMGRAIRKTWLKELVVQGMPIGILGYADGRPVAWCAVAPRSDHRRLGGPDDFADDPNAVWSITCFFIKRTWRGQKLTSRLIEAAIQRARQGGALVLEATPVEPDAPSYRFMGFTPVFARAGFNEVGTAGYRRHVMRLSLVHSDLVV